MNSEFIWLILIQHDRVSFAIINWLFTGPDVSSDLSPICLFGVIPARARGEEASGVKWSVSHRFALDPRRRRQLQWRSVSQEFASDPSTSTRVTIRQGRIRLGNILRIHHLRLITAPPSGPLDHLLLQAAKYYVRWGKSSGQNHNLKLWSRRSSDGCRMSQDCVATNCWTSHKTALWRIVCWSLV